MSHLCVNTLPASWQSVYTRIYDVFTHVYTTLAFLALLGAPYIYDISSLRVKHHIEVKSENSNYSMTINPSVSVHNGLLFTTHGTDTRLFLR